jgi:cysteinyl-tRNA synthetase
VSTGFRIYNTLSRAAEDFIPAEPGKLSLYVCGMTVYDHSHVGHARAMTVFDSFVRWRRAQGWEVKFVRNFTDVDDKIIRRANQEGVSAMVIAERYITSFHEDCDALGLVRPDHEPRVSTSMAAIIQMIQGLIQAGNAYAADGCVWFSVRTYPAYGRLSNQDVDAMQASPDAESSKQDHLDFALWKAAKPGEPAWDSPWGQGRPGWHIECSAMNREVLGSTIDIHGGGLDLIFPHHENEIAQSECANHTTYSRYWMHNGLLTLVKRTDEGNQLSAKMGKSLGNTFGIRDALLAFPAEALRLYYLSTHYRSPLPWSDEALPEALAMLARLYEARDAAAQMGGDGDAGALARDLGPEASLVYELGRGFEARFTKAMNDDFNTSEALGYAFELARAINRFGNLKVAKKRGGPLVAPALAALARLKDIGLLTLSGPEFHEEVKRKRLGAMGVSRDQVDALLEARTAARTAKAWADADRIRDQLDALGVIVMDRADGGVDWKVRLVEGA